MEPSAVKFAVDSLTDCYLQLCDARYTACALVAERPARGLEEWLVSLKEVRHAQQDHALRAAMQVPVDTNYLAALSRFDHGDPQAARRHLDLLPGISNPHSKTLVGEPPLSRLQLSSALMLQAMLQEGDTIASLQLLDRAQKALDYPLMRCSLDGARAYLPCLVQLHCIGLVRQLHEPGMAAPVMPFLLGALDGHAEPEQCSQVLLPLAAALEPRGAGRRLLRVSPANEAVAQQQGRAAVLLGRTRKASLPRHQGEHLSLIAMTMPQVAQKQRNLALASRLLERSNQSATCDFEAANISYIRGSRKAAFSSMLRIASSESNFANAGEDMRETPQIRALLKLAGWLCTDTNAEAILSSLGAETSTILNGISVPDLATNPASEFALACFCRATTVEPDSAKSWLRYGAWCFRQGRIIADESSSVINSEIEKQIGAPPSTALLEVCTKLFKDLESSADTASPTELLAALIAEVGETAAEQIHQLVVDLEAKVQAQVANAYREAVRSYVRYLKLNVGSGPQAATETNITVMLRLLRLLVKYGDQFADLFDDELAGCSAMAWRHIAPQLFARLGHPDSFVREQVMLRLQRVGTAAAHEVVYPAIVGTDTSTGSLALAYQAIESHLREHSPEMVSEVRSMLSALNELTTTSIEQWHSLLQPLVGEIGQRLTKVERETARVLSLSESSITEAERVRLVLQKYGAIMKPVVLALEKMQKATVMQTAQTAHERWFLHSFGDAIADAIAELKAPNDIHNLKLASDPVRALNKNIAKQMRQNMELELADVSPSLAGINSSIVAMPGLDSDGGVVTVHSFSSVLLVLPTKTKPKKLIIMGSDGKKYPYLLKGKEDLHLDERVMQFFRVANRMLASSASTASRGLAARHYAVIPLSNHSGLIQWVDQVVALHAIYKHWHDRNQKDQSGSSGFRPMEVWSGKIKAALQKELMTTAVLREEWPPHIVRNVFIEMQNSTRPDLLSKEIWCSASCSSEWWAKSRRFNRSVATMSMIGYVIGLGDRHLDNILLDKRSGEVVHIDYGICFEKGLKLRVPEVVPFRLTQCMHQALGNSGVEGMFRIGAEQVLQVLRQNKETLVTLLEAFVYDPLVDWEGDPEDEIKRSMELSVSLSLCASRIDEMRGALETNRDNLVNHFQQLEGTLARFVGSTEMIASAQEQWEADQTKQEECYTEINELAAKHTAADMALARRRSEHELCSEKVGAVHKEIEDMLAECTTVHQAHQATVDALEGLDSATLHEEITRFYKENCTKMNGILDMIAKRGGDRLTSDQQKYITELCATIPHNLLLRHQAVLDCLTQLSEYKHALGLLPDSYLDENAAYKCCPRLESALSSEAEAEGATVDPLVVSDNLDTQGNESTPAILQEQLDKLTEECAQAEESCTAVERRMEQASAALHDVSSDEASLTWGAHAYVESLMGDMSEILEQCSEEASSQLIKSLLGLLARLAQVFEIESHTGLSFLSGLKETLSAICTLLGHTAGLSDQAVKVISQFPSESPAIATLSAAISGLKLSLLTLKEAGKSPTSSAADTAALSDKYRSLLSDSGSDKQLAAVLAACDSCFKPLQSVDMQLFHCVAMHSTELDPHALLRAKVVFMDALLYTAQQGCTDNGTVSTLVSECLSSYFTDQLAPAIRLLGSQMLQSAEANSVESHSQSESQFGHALVEELCDARVDCQTQTKALQELKSQISDTAASLAVSQREAFQAEWFTFRDSAAVAELEPSSRPAILQSLSNAISTAGLLGSELPQQIDSLALVTKDAAMATLRGVINALLESANQVLQMSTGVISLEQHIDPRHESVLQIEARTAKLLQDEQEVHAEVQACVERIQSQDEELEHLAKLHSDACNAVSDAASRLVELEGRLSELQMQFAEVQQAVQQGVPAVQQAVHADAKLYGQLVSVLKTISKIGSRLKQDISPRVTALIDQHERFNVDAEALLQSCLIQAECGSAEVGPGDVAIPMLIEQISRVHDAVLRLGQDTASNAEQWAIQDVDEGEAAESASPAPPEAEEDGRKWQHEARNATAMSILRRVNQKLQGRDMDAGRKASISEQVGWVLEQATSVDKLSVMYEGWTGWI